MHKFRFSMENLLKYRQSIEEQKKQQLAKAIQRAQREERCLNKLFLEKQNCLSSTNSGAVNVTMMQQQEAYLSLLDVCLERQRKKLDEAQKAVKKHRMQLAEAARRRQIIENLKEKRLEEYRYMILKEEQKALDEAGIATYCRKAE